MCERSCSLFPSPVLDRVPNDSVGSVKSWDTGGFISDRPNNSLVNVVSQRLTSCPKDSIPCETDHSVCAAPPPPPPPLPPQTFRNLDKSPDLSAPLEMSKKLNLHISSRVSPLLSSALNSSKMYKYGGKIRGVPALNETCTLRYIDIETELQSGPTCGIVALKMIASLVCDLPTSKILAQALGRSFTRRGEMFCAKNMYDLAVDVVGERCKVELHEDIFPNNEDRVWELLAQNALFLVPYDVDKNNTPGLFGGNRAHWAVLNGLAKVKEERFVVAVQGKSRYVAVWPLSDLSLSNSQLNEIDPSLFIKDSRLKTIVPNLKGHAISFTFSQETNIRCFYARRH